MFPPLIEKLSRHEDLTSDEASAAMAEVMEGRAAPAQIAGLLIGLVMKGERPAELVGLARTMRAHAVQMSRPYGQVFDTCGTGGDRSGTFNISSCAAIVVAACGVRVAKHGNRSVSSLCGSADLLEMLGVKVDLTPDQVAQCLEKTGFGFFFAPVFHPAVKAAMPARKRIQGKTLFNILGPLSNPAGASYQLVGVYEDRLVMIAASALAKLGAVRALVVHSADGLDEISLSAETHMAELQNGKITEYKVVPEDFNLKREPLSNLRCETPEQNLAAAQSVLRGDSGAGAKIVCLNAAAALYVAGKTESIKQGVLIAMDALTSGAAEKKLKAIAAFTKSL